MGLPHSEPVARHMTVKQAPTGALALAIRKPSGWRQINAMALAMAIEA